MYSIYNLSWSEDAFPHKLRLLCQSLQDKNAALKHGSDKEVANSYSALSSTCYSIAGTAGAKLYGILRGNFNGWRKLKYLLIPIQLSVYVFSWLPIGLFCYLMMLVYSNRVVSIAGYKGMTADQCDIRQSILRKRNLFQEARLCIKEAFAKEPQGHTAGLLYIGLAYLFKEDDLRDKANSAVLTAVGIAFNIQANEPRQAVRIFRAAAELTDWLNYGNRIKGDWYRKEATRLAQSVGAKDQIAKIRA